MARNRDNKHKVRDAARRAAPFVVLAALAALAGLITGSMTVLAVVLAAGIAPYLTSSHAARIAKEKPRTDLAPGADADDSPDVSDAPSAVVTEDEPEAEPQPTEVEPEPLPEPDPTPQFAPEEESQSIEPLIEHIEYDDQIQIEETLPSEDELAEDVPSDDTPVPTPRLTDDFSYHKFRLSLIFSDDPVEFLKKTVVSIHQRKGKDYALETKHDEPQVDPDNAPSPFELFLAHLLEEAGLFEETKPGEGVENVVIPHHSGLYYLRPTSQTLGYGSFLRVLRIEAALNTLHLAHEYLQDRQAQDEEELYRIAQRITSSICAQVPDVDMADWSYLAMPWQRPYGPAENGEWTVREALSNAIESLKTPYRLEAKFRTNVDGGDVAIEFRVTDARVFPKSLYVDGIGIVPSTRHMRRREASRYAARMGLLLANHAFRASNRIRRVWISAVHQTSTQYACWYSVCLDRRPFSHVHMSSIVDPITTLRALGANIQDDAGILTPVDACFYLEDERFCPKFRHDIWTLSERELPAADAPSLGTKRVSGLVIHEELGRMLAAQDALTEIDSAHATTLSSVRAIMDAAEKTSDISVWRAAERVAGELVEGSIAADDVNAIQNAMQSSGTLEHALERLHTFMSNGDLPEAVNYLRKAIVTSERECAYEDTPSVTYRSFSSFTERVLYNREHADDKRSVVLVPDSYLVAQMTLSSLLMACGKQFAQEAIEHARTAVRLAPYTFAARLLYVTSLEQAGDLEQAAEELKDMLERGYEPRGIGLGYYRMASLQYKLDNREACQACYQRAAMVLPDLVPLIMTECQALVQQGMEFDEEMNLGKIDRTLASYDIPVAPTEDMAFALYDSATASVDAEVFPVAHDLMNAITSLTGDDVMRGIRNSLENEPDL